MTTAAPSSAPCGCFARAIEACQLALERALGLILGARIEAGVNAQARLGEILLVIVAPQRAAHEIEIRRVVGARRAGGDAKRRAGRGSRLGRLDDALIGEDFQHQVAPCARALGMAARIVVGRPAHDRDQQRNLRQVELRERLAEVELAREPEAVDGAVAVLAEEDLIDIGVHEIGLGEVRIERHRHDRLAQLSRERLAGIEEVAAHQLLREGAAALLDLAGAHVDPGRAQHRNGVDAVMSVELAVLDRLERRGQERRDFRRREDDTILAVDRKNAADEERLEAQHRQLLAGAVAQAREHRSCAADGEHLCRARLLGKAGRAQRHLDVLALPAVGAGALELLGALVVQSLQLVLELRERQRQPGVQLQGRGIHLRGQRPAAALELLRHQMVEIQHVERGGQRRGADDG